MKQAPKPACLIAFNGLRFDFRILLIELQRYNFNKTLPIPEEVYFFDAYLSCLDIEKNHHEYILKTTNCINWRKGLYYRCCKNKTFKSKIFYGFGNQNFATSLIYIIKSVCS